MKTILAVVLGLSVTGCSWFQSNAPVITADVAQLVLCVVSHDGEPPAQIAVECGAQALQDVTTILDASHAATAKTAAAKRVDAGH